MKHLALLLSTFLSIVTGANDSGRVLLTTGNTVTFRGVVDENSVVEVEQDLLKAVKTRGRASYPIYLVMDSPGGSISAGLDFINFVSTLPNIKTVSIFAASMASGIVEALPGERLTVKTGILMFHRAKGSFEGQFDKGEVEAELNMATQIVLTMEQTSADRLKISLADYKERIKDEWWEVGQNAVAANMADRIITVECSDSLIKKEVKKTTTVFIFTIEETFSACPLLRAPLSSSSL